MVTSKRQQTKSSTVVLFLGTLLLSFAISVFCGAPAYSQGDAYADSDVEDLVLAINAGRSRLSPGFFALQKNGRYYFPIGELSDILKFNADIDDDFTSITGFAVSEDKEYTIDLAANEVRYNNRTGVLSPEYFIDPTTTDGDVYILEDVLEEIWPLELNVDLGNLVLTVVPDTTLPFERILERKNRQERAASNIEKRKRENITDLPFVANPYRAFSKPSFDFDSSVGFDARTSKPEYQFSANGVQDLGYASADYSLSFSERDGRFNRPDNLRLRFRRQNIHDGALPFGLEDVQWGDVRLENRDVIASGLNGRGIIFSTDENNNRNEFDLITVDGVGIPGWETELYLNNELIDFGVVDTRGEYRFEDVSVRFGNNRIRVVLYGPQGQIRERVENYLFQTNMVPVGQNRFSGGVIDSQRDLIPIDRRSRLEPDGLAANLYGARGIAENITVFSSASTLQDEEGSGETSRQYLTAGAIGAFKNTLAQVEVLKEVGAGEAVDIRTLSDFKGFQVNARGTFYSDFESPDADNDSRSKERELEVNVQRIFPTPLGSLGLEVGAEYLKRRDDRTISAYTSRQSLGVGPARITNQTRTILSDGDHSSTRGTVSATTRTFGWRLRNSLNYETFPDVELTSVQAELRYGRSRDYSTSFNASHNLEQKETVLGAQISKDFGKFLGSVETDWSNRFGTSILFRASTSLGPFGPNGDYRWQSDTVRGAGPVSSLVYLDNDYDGVFGEGDEPVENAKLVISRRVTQEKTDAEGRLTEVNNIREGRTNVFVSETSIEDPYLIPAIEGVSIYPRPGVTHNLEFPLIETGAIDGTLRWETGGKPIAGLVLQLMNPEAEIIQESKTAPDGYFTFERIPPGSYTIRADPESGVTIPFKTVELTPDNLFQFGKNIDIVDLSGKSEEGFAGGLSDDGLMRVKDIVSIAKIYKEKRKFKSEVSVPQKSSAVPDKTSDANFKSTVSPADIAPASGGDFITNAPTSEKETSQINNDKVSSNTSAAVTSVRVGEHPNRVRVVLDLSAQLNYTIEYDEGNNLIYVDLPQTAWSTGDNWQSKTGNILNNYRVEELSTAGSRLVFEVQEGVKLGSSGLLKAAAGRKDRLYIDIEG